jgi:putative nucleotidyltransferase with HDIG domain
MSSERQNEGQKGTPQKKATPGGHSQKGLGPKDRWHKTAVQFRQISRQLPLRAGTRYMHYAYRVALLLSAAILIDLAFPVQSAPDLPVLDTGMVASEDVIAPVAFTVYKSEPELTQERAEAAASISPIFDHRPEMADSSAARATAFFDSVAAAASSTDDSLERRSAVAAVLESYRIPTSENRVALLAQQELRDQMAAAMERAFADLLRPGRASNADLGTVSSGGVILRSVGNDQRLSREALPTMQEFYTLAGEAAPTSFDAPEVTLYQFLLIRFSDPTIQLNRNATEAARGQARLAVDPMKYQVLEGERIIAAHERVGPDEMEALRALESQIVRADGGGSWEAQFGGLLYNLLLLLILGLVVRYWRPMVYESNRSLTLIWLLVLAVAGGAALIAWAGWPSQLIPVALAALILATLFDGLLALVAVFVLVGLVTARSPFIGLTVLFPMLLGGAAAALSGRVVTRRAHAWTFAAIIAAAYIMAALCLGLIGHSGLDTVATGAFWGTINGVASALLATGILPLAESFTKITTDQTLLELADLNRPLLRRLSLEAPGTYAHSINVANLAEAAARDIGANSLLERVGVYYHDIGKVKKPQYFVENQPRGRNPHDKLKPTTSASIVREHVKDGLDLATEARLPDVVKAFIPEHHGTQKIGFFLDKAREEDPDGDIDPADFRYPGPKPQTRETAIALLADSVESAARVLQDPTQESIHALVDRIVDFKMSEHQLDEAPLTLRELSIVKQAFLKVLSGMYHSRLDYPPQNNQKEEGPAARGAS